ncbi:MAG: FAD:protein FMN transferase [Actinobacteria bacterium]|nr:FAD:protein FMN transferase [Actinomycetota bacterium]
MRRVELIWGTAISIEIVDDVAPDALDAVYAWFRRVDDLFSTWRDDSEISRIARGELEVAEASPEVPVILALCDEVRDASGGAFDITFGARAGIEARPGIGALDPSGVVKGWAVEAAAAMLLGAGAQRFCINAGGDVVVRGSPESDPAWRIGIRHPWDPDKLAAVVCMTEGAVATSGNYERGDHVVDARTGLPPSGLASVTVVGASLTMADAYATAAFAMGRDGISWLAGRPDVEAMAITEDAVVVSTDGFDRYRAT